MQIVRYQSSQGEVAFGIGADGQVQRRLPVTTLSDLLHLHIDELRALLEQSLQQEEAEIAGTWLAPVEGEIEVWAAGVTYKRSMAARMEESETPDIYNRVYTAERPELFFKANARRVACPGDPVVIRADSAWDVPEPELALVVNTHGEIVGYTVGNDMSSRSIEGENPLYLPQAKVYAGACALGPAITPAWTVKDPYALTMHMTIERGGQLHWQGETSTSLLNRRLDQLVAYLFREDEFPDGVILCTGTALVPEEPFTLQEGDRVSISIDHIGTLSNPVVRGKAGFIAARRA